MAAPGATERVDTALLVTRAREGDQTAWEQLVDRYGRLVWATTRDFRIAPSDAADVSQTTWLRLLEHLDRIDPAKVSAWLATTARRECLRVLAVRKRVLLTLEAETLVDVPANEPPADERLLRDERAEDVRDALDALPDRWQELVRLSTSDPPVSYAEISATLGMPVGSIGPIRGRCFAKLRTLLEH